MAIVCKWLGFYLCMKEPDLNERIRTGGTGSAFKCDMVVALKAESPKEKRGGVAFEVILQPALAPNPPPVVRDFTPLKKDASSNFDEIARKMREAEDRRQSAEMSKLRLIAKDKERAVEASQRVHGLNESFSRDSERKLTERMEASAGNRSGQVKALQDRLREHAQRVEEVRSLGERASADLKERIERKLETAGEKRDAQLHSIQERIRQHKQHIDKVLEQSSKFSKDTEEKIIQKMEASVKNRDEQINHLLERLKDHERRVEQVRLNKVNQSRSNDSNVSGSGTAESSTNSSRDATLNDDIDADDDASLDDDNDVDSGISPSTTSTNGAVTTAPGGEGKVAAGGLGVDDDAKNGDSVVAEEKEDAAAVDGPEKVGAESGSKPGETSVCDSESSEEQYDAYVLAPSREGTPVDQAKAEPGKTEKTLACIESSLGGPAGKGVKVSDEVDPSSTNGLTEESGEGSSATTTETNGITVNGKMENVKKLVCVELPDEAKEWSEGGPADKGLEAKEKESAAGGDASCSGGEASPRTTLC